KDFLQGQAPTEAINILWQFSGTATGAFNSTTVASVHWTPTAPGNVSFTVTLQGAITSHVYGTKTVGPIAVGPSALGTWSGSAALKLKLDKSPAPGIYQGFVGDTVNF